MSFFNKVKQTTNELGKMTKITVEQNRLKLQISSKQKEVESIKHTMGDILFKQYSAGQSVPTEVEAYCANIQSLLDEVKEIHRQIKELSGEKDCPSCGNTIKLEAKFCPSCGYKINENELDVEPVLIEEVVVFDCENPDCNEQLTENDKFCGECGTENPQYKGE